MFGPPDVVRWCPGPVKELDGSLEEQDGSMGSVLGYQWGYLWGYNDINITRKHPDSPTPISCCTLGDNKRHTLHSIGKINRGI